MKFFVRRTSEWHDEKPPCKGAYRDAYTRIDRRSADDPKKVPAYKGEDAWWYGDGENHRLIGKQIARDFPDEEWFIDIADLDALLKLVKKEGAIVVQASRHSDKHPEIEIYDDYRE